MPIRRDDRVVGGLRVATLSIDHAPVNILDMAHCRELTEQLRALREEDRARIVVFRGAGRCFSTGVEIKEHTPKKMPELLPAFHSIFHEMLRLEALTVAAVHSFCLGGAAELALACDRVVAEQGARIGFPEMKVGCYPPIAMPLMTTRTGLGHAARTILSGEEIPMEELRAWGLVHRTAPKGELDAAVDEELTLYSDKSPDVLGMAALMLHEEAHRQWGVRIEALEKSYLDTLLPHPDAAEGIAAFGEKRAPKWRRAEQGS